MGKKWHLRSQVLDARLMIPSKTPCRQMCGWRKTPDPIRRARLYLPFCASRVSYVLYLSIVEWLFGPAAPTIRTHLMSLSMKQFLYQAFLGCTPAKRFFILQLKDFLFDDALPLCFIGLHSQICRYLWTSRYLWIIVTKFLGRPGRGTGSRVEGRHFIKLWYEVGISLWNDKLLCGTRLWFIRVDIFGSMRL